MTDLEDIYDETDYFHLYVATCTFQQNLHMIILSYLNWNDISLLSFLTPLVLFDFPFFFYFELLNEIQ